MTSAGEADTAQQNRPALRRRILGLVAYGAWFGSVCGAIFGCELATRAGIRKMDPTVNGLLGGMIGGAVAMFLVALAGGRKCPALDGMKSTPFIAAFATIFGGIVGIALLPWVGTMTGRTPGAELNEDCRVIATCMAAIGSLLTWGVSHWLSQERRAAWLVLGAFLGTVACMLYLPPAMPLAIAGAVAGLLSQRLLTSRGNRQL